MTNNVAAPYRLASRLPAFAAPAAVAVVCGAATLLVAAVDPHEAGHYPTCPSLLITGWYCPGCGSLRAVHDLAHGNVAGAMDMNPFALVAIAWLVWRWGWWLAASLGRGRSVRPAPGWLIYGLAGVVGAYWLLRNVGPFASYLAP